jgi:ABC-type methionine transport system ATPase subunit
LPPTTAHRLAAISAPVEVVDHVLDRAVNGVIVPDGEVEEMFRSARNQRKQANKKDRRSRVASASAYRRSEAGRRKEELCRLEREDQRKSEFRCAALCNKLAAAESLTLGEVAR